MSKRTLFAGILFVVILAWAQKQVLAEPQAESELTRRNIDLQETTELIISISWPKEEADYRFTLPRLSLHNLEIKRRGESQETFRDGNGKGIRIRKTFSIELKPLEKGPARIDPLTIRYVDSAKGFTGEIQIPEYGIRVKAERGVLTGLLTIMLMAGIAGVVFFYYRRRREGRSRQAVDPQERESLENKKVNRIKDIAASYEKGESVDVLGLMGQELKDFLKRRYQIEKILDEETFLNELNSRDIGLQEQRHLKRLFGILREARYSGREVSADEIRELKEDMIRYIEGKRIVGNPE